MLRIIWARSVGDNCSVASISVGLGPIMEDGCCLGRASILLFPSSFADREGFTDEASILSFLAAFLMFSLTVSCQGALGGETASKSIQP